MMSWTVPLWVTVVPEVPSGVMVVVTWAWPLVSSTEQETATEQERAQLSEHGVVKGHSIYPVDVVFSGVVIVNSYLLTGCEFCTSVYPLEI